MNEIKWNDVDKKGSPKKALGFYLVTLQNEYVTTMTYSNLTDTWNQIGVGRVVPENPVIAWANIPKPYKNNKSTKRKKDLT